MKHIKAIFSETFGKWADATTSVKLWNIIVCLLLIAGYYINTLIALNIYFYVGSVIAIAVWLIPDNPKKHQYWLLFIPLFWILVIAFILCELIPMMYLNYKHDKASQ